jgi:L-galactose dehydrogenase
MTGEINMEYRTLGKTGLKVSALSFGASSLGGVFRPVDEAEAIRTVHTALDLGINYIDVAPFYGYTVAETVLGKALHGVPRASYYLATKVGRYGDAEFDFSAARVTASIDESLDRLGVETLDVIQAHDLEYGSLDQVVEETLPALWRARAAGKVRFVGITGYPLKIFDYVLARTGDGAHGNLVDTILSYNHYTLNDTSLTALIPALQAQDIGIINASPLSQGLLTNRGTPDWHPAPRAVKEICAQAAEHCRRQGADIAKLAMQFAVANSDIATTIVGSASPENMRRNVAWLEEPVDEALLAEVQAILAPVRDQTWTTGRPENN